MNLKKKSLHFIRQQLSKLRIRQLLRGKGELFLDLGAGNKKGENGWVTMDLTAQCDIYWDLRNELPFPNKSISKIYSSHFFEHLSFKEAHSFLEDCFRVMVSGGTISICVPDARKYIDAYVKNVDLDRKQFLDYEPAYNATTRIDYVNYIAYMDGEHKYMFDADNLLSILSSHRFRDVRLRRFDPDLDLRERDCMSIYAEARK